MRRSTGWPRLPRSPSGWTKAPRRARRTSYLVQRIVPAGAKTAESELSDAATITVKDTFPPAVPTGLRGGRRDRVDRTDLGAQPEADLAGYRIYRSVGDGPFEKVGDAALPAYSDRAVEAGKAYRYRVTAVDASGNESDRSAEVGGDDLVVAGRDSAEAAGSGRLARKLAARTSCPTISRRGGRRRATRSAN